MESKEKKSKSNLVIILLMIIIIVLLVIIFLLSRSKKTENFTEYMEAANSEQEITTTPTITDSEILNKVEYYGETTSETYNPEEDDYEGEPVGDGTAYVINDDELCADLDDENHLSQVNSIVQASADILNLDEDIAYTYSVDERGHLIFDSSVLQLDVYLDTSCDTYAFDFTIK